MKRKKTPEGLRELRALYDQTAALFKRDDVRPFFVEAGKRGGKIGGKKRAAGMTPEQRSALARKAARKRWKGHKKK